jgi:hypothetical protein
MAASTSFKHIPPPPALPSAKLLSKVQNSSINVPMLANMAPPSREEAQCEKIESVMKIDVEMAGMGGAENVLAQIAPPPPVDRQCENKELKTWRIEPYRAIAPPPSELCDA